LGNGVRELYVVAQGIPWSSPLTYIALKTVKKRGWRVRGEAEDMADVSHGFR
jgi:hypothetical protein